MGIIKQVFASPVRRKAFDPLEGIDLEKVVGWRSVGGSSVYGYYKDKQYENGYSSISKLGNGFAAIEQYTIDKNGKGVPSNILDRLYTPNTDMSAYDFREALAVCSLVHNKVRLRVHHRGTRINAESILGFTFMEDYSETIVEGKRRYHMGNGDLLTDAEVITLKSVNPDNITDGFSPSQAARRWTRLDDYIADYQKGFFENGAVPSGQMIITAKTPTEFNDIVDKIQEKHRGAGRNNNITYAHRPTDQNGAPLNSQIEWVPFSSQNKDMALKDLFENVNKKIDSAYGVPEEIRGHLSNSNYASVAVAEKVFVKYALNPMTMKIWQKFTHELNRITGGTGVAITYDLEIPVIADEEKVKAEAKSVDAATVATLVEGGFELKTAIEYVQTGDISKLVKATVVEEKPDVLSPEEARGTPDQPLDIYSKYVDVKIDQVIKAIEQKEVVKPPKKKEVAKKELTETDKLVAENKVRQIVRDQISRQVDIAIGGLDVAIASKAYGDPEPEQDDHFVEEMMTVILPVLTVYGSIQTAKGLEMILDAGLSTEGIQRFFVTEAQRLGYRKYLTQIGQYFNVQTGQKIRSVLEDGFANQLTKAEIESNLRGLVREEWRINRMATTEINRAGGRAAVMSMANIKNDTGYDIEKTMQHNGPDSPCEFCAARLGVWYPVDQSMVQKGEVVEGVDGGKYVNTWEDNFGNDIHANGHCTPIFRVRRD